jgi:hypothetical protein
MHFNRPFLQYPVRSIFAALEDQLENLTVVIDRTGSSEFRKAMAKNLKSDLNEQFGRQVIKRVKDEPSHSNNLLQLADMACCAVTRSLNDGKKDQGCYREIIYRKEGL